MEKLNKALDWLSKDKNLKNLRTGSTLIFILVFVVYFYGFRTGFQISISDIADILLDIFIIIFSALLIINEYTMRGIDYEIEKSKIDGTEDYLNRVISEHEKLVENMDDDLVHSNIYHWNIKEDQKAMEEVKRGKIEKLKEKRRKYEVKSRKYKRITKKIEELEDPNTTVKFKRKQTTLGNVKKRGPMRKANEKEIREDYSPKRDTLVSQSGLAIVVAFAMPMLRLAMEPSMEAVGEAVLFLMLLVPFLVFRAVLAYQISRANTRDKYPESVQYRIKIIKWCQNYKHNSKQQENSEVNE